MKERTQSTFYPFIVTTLRVPVHTHVVEAITSRPVTRISARHVPEKRLGPEEDWKLSLTASPLTVTNTDTF